MPRIDYRTRDYEGFRSEMIRRLKEKMPEYTDFSSSDAGIVILELLAESLDVLSYYNEVVANEVFLETAYDRENVIKLAQMLGKQVKEATPAKFFQVFEITPQDKDVVIPKGFQLSTKESSPEKKIFFELERDLRIPAGKTGLEKDSNGDYLYKVPVVEGKTISPEVVGTSNESPNQSFRLAYRPVLKDSVRLLVHDGVEFEEWQRVENFIDSTSTSKHFMVRLDESAQATVIFGNGTFGKIPNRVVNGIIASYRIGGGEIGNVTANSITEIVAKPAYMKRTFNPDLAYEKGRNRESTERIRIDAPNTFRTVWGALTLKDFADVVKLRFPEVVFAVAERDADEIDDIHIYMLLEDNAPLTEEFKERVHDIFDENKEGRKIIGVRTIHLEPATLVPVNFTGTLRVKEGFYAEDVEQEVRAFFNEFFAIGKYPFNQELAISELVSKIVSEIDGIRSLRITSPTEEIIEPALNEILTLGNLDLTVTGGL